MCCSLAGSRYHLGTVRAVAAFARSGEHARRCNISPGISWKLWNLSFAFLSVQDFGPRALESEGSRRRIADNPSPNDPSGGYDTLSNCRSGPGDPYQFSKPPTRVYLASYYYTCSCFTFKRQLHYHHDQPPAWLRLSCTPVTISLASHNTLLRWYPTNQQRMPPRSNQNNSIETTQCYIRNSRPVPGATLIELARSERSMNHG